MNTPSLGKLLCAFCLYLALLAGATAANWKSNLVPLGDNTYAATREATNAFNRDTDALKAGALDDATKFCASQGKEMKVVSTMVDKPKFSLGFVSAKIVFMALKADDPELTKAPEPIAASASPMASGDLYTDLLKLDDLRKKGILTDKEFDKEKKKILQRSK